MLCLGSRGQGHSGRWKEVCESGQLVFLLGYMKALTHFETLEFFNYTVLTLSVCSPARLVVGVVKRAHPDV